MQRREKVIRFAAGALGLILALVALILASPEARAETSADLEVVSLSDSPDPVYVGNDLTYTVTVKNNGPNVNGDADLVVTVPDEVEFVSARPVDEPLGTEDPACAPNGFDGEFATAEPNVITCQLYDATESDDSNTQDNKLAVDTSRTIEIIVAPTASGRNKEASATVVSFDNNGGSEADPEPSNDTERQLSDVRGRNCTIIGAPTIHGVSGDDGNLRGTAEDDVICGLSGDDTISGLGGNDIIYGGVGNDTIHGGEGNDTIRGGVSRTSPDNDPTTISDLDSDKIYGDLGSDTVPYEDALAGVVVNLGPSGAFDRNPGDRNAQVGSDIYPGADVENALGSSFGDQMVGTVGPNVLSGLLDENMVGEQPCADDFCKDMIDGLGVNDGDMASYSYSRSGMTVSLSNGSAGRNQASEQDKDSIANVENAFGSRLNDTLSGNSGNNQLTGGLGNDKVTGGSGQDKLGQIVNQGQIVFPEDGNDALNAKDGAGGDRVDGGKGTRDSCKVDAGDTKTGCP